MKINCSRSYIARLSKYSPKATWMFVKRFDPGPFIFSAMKGPEQSSVRTLNS